jgi:hypothetical protein
VPLPLPPNNRCEEWFGAPARQWRFLRRYEVAYAQPAQAPLEGGGGGGGAADEGGGFERPKRLGEGLYVCGDHMSTPTLNGAIASGEAAAAAALRDLAARRLRALRKPGTEAT